MTTAIPVWDLVDAPVDLGNVSTFNDVVQNLELLVFDVNPYAEFPIMTSQSSTSSVVETLVSSISSPSTSETPKDFYKKYSGRKYCFAINNSSVFES